MLAQIRKHRKDAENSGIRGLLILGSGWDRNLADRLKADLLIISVPVQYRLIMNCGYAGYAEGFEGNEDIYDRVLNTYR